MYTKQSGSSRGKPTFIPNKENFLFNVDTFWFTIDIDNYDDIMNGYLREELETGRAALDEGEVKTIDVTLSGYDNPISFEIGRGQAPVYAYQIRNQDFAFYFTKRKREDKTYPIKVQINQFILWDKKVLGAYMESVEVLYRLGFKCGDAKPNRIDLCCHSDQFKWTLSDLEESVFSFPQNIAKDNYPNFYKLNPSTGEFQTVEFGDRSRLATRIYNKSAEIKAKNKDYFRDIYMQKGINPDGVWNIEFELHRDLLKEFVSPYDGLPNYFDTIENLLSDDGLNLLWTWLTKYQYQHNSKFWKTLQEGDPTQFTQTGNYVIRAKDIDSSLYREIKQIRGRLKKFILTTDQTSINEAISNFYEMMIDVEKDEHLNFDKEVINQKKLYHDKKINGLLSQDQKCMIELNRQNRQKKMNSEEFTKQKKI